MSRTLRQAGILWVAVLSAAMAGADTAPSPSTAAAPARAILLPVDFTVYEVSAAGPEAVPDWTESARTNIAQQLKALLSQRANLELVPMPDLSPDERRLLEEYLAVAKLVALQGSRLKTSEWKSRRAEFDRHLGPDLQFLAERAGADYLILVHGTQSKRSGGLLFADVVGAVAGLIPSPVGGTTLSTLLVSMKSGDVQWFNVALGAEAFAGVGTDLRDPDSAAKILARLMEPYPAIPALEPRP